MIQSILVPVDGSPFADQALPVAVALARRMKAHIEVAHVYVPPAAVYEGMVLPEMESQIRRHCQHFVEEKTRALTIQTGLPVTPVLLGGAVSKEIHDYALSAGVDLIVMATHGRGGWSRFWLGSVADELVRTTSIPLLLVRPKEGGVPADAVPTFQKIVVPLDGSAVAEQILPIVSEFARACGAAIKLVRAVTDVPMIQYLGEPEAMRYEAEMFETLEQDAGKYLTRVAGPLKAQNLMVETEVLVRDSAGAAILDAAHKAKASLIAMGTHGRGQLARTILGSTTDKVVRGADIPVLLFHASATKTPSRDPVANAVSAQI